MRPASFVALATLLLLAACGSQQRDVPPWLRPAQQPRNENYHGGPVAMLLRYDSNHDGILEYKELVAGMRAEFAAADTHHTGCLDDNQAAAINQQRLNADQSTATPLVDWNHDGCIDYTEFSAAAYSLFDQLDRNNDHKLTPDEMGQKKGAPKEPGGLAEPGAQPGEGGGRHSGHPRGPRGGGPGGQNPGSGMPGDEGGSGNPLPAVPN